MSQVQSLAPSPPSTAGSRCLAVRHETRYAYDSDIEVAQHSAWLQPRDCVWQPRKDGVRHGVRSDLHAIAAQRADVDAGHHQVVGQTGAGAAGNALGKAQALFDRQVFDGRQDGVDGGTAPRRVADIE